MKISSKYCKVVWTNGTLTTDETIKIGTTTLGNMLYTKTKHKHTHYGPTISLQGTYPKEMLTYVPKDMYKNIR